jgi:uncharacterized membrane protein YciS (DUF1049 family)
MNTLLIIGLVIFGVGALLWIVCTAMIAHYDQKLEALDKKIRKDDKWRNAQKRDEIDSQERSLF